MNSASRQIECKINHKALIHCQHGRLKVKTTAQQEEAKRKEREQKLKIYNAATSTAFKKVSKHCKTFRLP